MWPFWFLLVLLQLRSFSPFQILPQKYSRQHALRPVSSNTEDNPRLTLAKEVLGIVSILTVGYGVFSQGENIRIITENMQVQGEALKSQGEAMKSQGEALKSQGDVVKNVDMKFNIAGGGTLLTIGLLAASSNIVKVLEYFDKRSERAQKK